MRALRLAAGTAAIVTALLAAVLTGPPAQAGPAVGPAVGPVSIPGCGSSYQPPNGWTLNCSHGGGVPGGGGGGGGGSGQSKYACTLIVMSPSQIQYLRLPKAPKGETWDVIACPGRYPFGGVTLVSANGTPAVTPQELLQIAVGELRVPALQPKTAPPLGRDGLVGLPVWYAVPASRWHPVTVYVAAGPVWAEAIAAPQRLTFQPGAGLPGSSCAGPGAALPAAALAAAAPAGSALPGSALPGPAASCTYTYDQSSARQPGGAYQASVAVTWRVTWTGAGGAGGVLNAGLQVGYPVTLRVAEAQALVTGR